MSRALLHSIRILDSGINLRKVAFDELHMLIWGRKCWVQFLYYNWEECIRDMQCHRERKDFEKKTEIIITLQQVLLYEISHWLVLKMIKTSAVNTEYINYTHININLQITLMKQHIILCPVLSLRLHL